MAGMPTPGGPPHHPIIIQLFNIEGAREALLKIEATVALSLMVLDKAPEYGEAAALDGVREVFAGLSAARERADGVGCRLPHARLLWAQRSGPARRR